MAIPIRIIWIVLMPAKVAEVFFCLTTYQHQRTFQNKCLPSPWGVYFHRIQSRTSIFCQTLPRIPKNLLTHFKALDWRVFISTEFKVQSTSISVKSKHLKSQLDPPVGDVTFLHHRRSVRSPCWLRTPQNCILARWSNLGLAGRRPALA